MTKTRALSKPKRIRKKRIRKSGVIRPVGPYSQDVVLGHIDRRTREGRAIATFREELIQHIGGCPSAPQRRMIDMAAQLHLRAALMDDRFAATGEVNDLESRMYLAWTNTLAKLLASLGAPANASQPGALSLAAYLAATEDAGMVIEGDDE